MTKCSLAILVIGLVVSLVPRTSYAAERSCESLWVPASSSLTLRSARLEMRPLTEENAEELFKIWSDPYIKMNLGSKVPPTLEGTREYLLRSEHDIETFKRAPTRILWGIYFEGKMVGMTSVQSIQSMYAIGYAVAADFEGRGFATEAAKRLVDFLMIEGKAPGIIATAYLGNVRSQAVLGKIGFVPHETFDDYILFQLARKAWSSKQEAAKSEQP